MKTAAMCFSLLQFPRCRIYTLTNFWRGSFYNLGRASGVDGVFCTNNYDLEGGYSRRWTRRTIHTETGGKSTGRNIHTETGGKSTEKTSIRHEIIPPTTSTKSNTSSKRSRTISIEKEIISGNANTKLTTSSIVEETVVQSDEYYNELAKLATIICFDIETTGFKNEKNRIIEIALQDLRGGENSTFQTLVNPERDVPNEQVHGISSRMVRRPSVPRMKELIPILLQYVESRQLPGGIVVLVSHNGRTFDVPFLKYEFTRCSYEIPSDWFFADTMSLARELMKSKGPKVPAKISLQALREHYNIPLIGSAHRALSDVHSLSLVLQRLTYDLKLPISGLIKASFK